MWNHHGEDELLGGSPPSSARCRLQQVDYPRPAFLTSQWRIVDGDVNRGQLRQARLKSTSKHRERKHTELNIKQTKSEASNNAHIPLNTPSFQSRAASLAVQYDQNLCVRKSCILCAGHKGQSTLTGYCRTGATGYIGGDALYAIAQAHPEYELTCLVRNSDKGVSFTRSDILIAPVANEIQALVAKQYPKARLYADLTTLQCHIDLAKQQYRVYGDLDSVDLIAEESSKADIVCRELVFSLFDVLLLQPWLRSPLCQTSETKPRGQRRAMCHETL